MGKKAKTTARQSSFVKRERKQKEATKHPTNSSLIDCANRPRNHLITDATKNFDFTFERYGKKHTVTVRQTAAEETWPGGALWDLGVLLAHVMVSGWTRGATSQHILSSTCPAALQRNVAWKSTVVLELGCGVGLTGLIAAALGAQVTVLTDLDVVVERVTKPNVELNSRPGPNKTCGYRTMMPGGGKVAAFPLCWGREKDETATKELLNSLSPVKSARGKHSLSQERAARFPDLIIIGDVAYQHKPGAPSHFDALMSTLMKFVGDNTTVLFGTRMRMPASNDLLVQFREHLEEEVTVEAHEVDASLLELDHKHNMTVHVFRQKDDGLPQSHSAFPGGRL